VDKFSQLGAKSISIGIGAFFYRRSAFKFLLRVKAFKNLKICSPLIFANGGGNRKTIQLEKMSNGVFLQS